MTTLRNYAPCPYCKSESFTVYRRNSRPWAQTQVVCDGCGASKIDISAHDPTRAEQAPFDAERNKLGRVAGEWER